MNRGLSVEQLDGLLDERRLAVMSTFRADGTVLLSPLWFIWEDGGFTIGMAAGDGKLKHLRRDPRVTIVVNEDEFPYRGFEVRGEARLLDVPVRTGHPPDRDALRRGRRRRPSTTTSGAARSPASNPARRAAGTSATT